MTDRVAVKVLEEEKEALATEEEKTEKCIQQLAMNVAEIAKCRFSLMEVNQCIVQVVFKKIRVILVKRDRNLEENEILLNKKSVRINRTMC